MSENAFDRTTLGHEASRLLDALSRLVDEEGRAQLSASVLLKESGLTQGALIRARSELTRHRLLRTEPGFSANGLRGANVYVVDMEAVKRSENGPEPVQNDADPSVVTRPPAGTGDSGASGRRRDDRKRSWPWFRRGSRSS